MKETVVYISAEGKIIDVDAHNDGFFVALSDLNEVLTHRNRFLTNLEMRFPKIRIAAENKILLADTRSIGNEVNVHLFDFNGNQLTSFWAGDAIEDIVVHNDKIVVGYFDEGVYGSEGPNKNGLSVFDMDGKFLFGFNKSSENLTIDDCYCLCKHEAEKVLFYFYSAFHVVELNLHNFTWKSYELTEELHGASAMSGAGDKVIFHFFTFRDSYSIFTWDRISGEVSPGETYTSTLRGLGNGEFLAKGECGFTIIDPLENGT
jgi:hypothetical protein